MAFWVFGVSPSSALDTKGADIMYSATHKDWKVLMIDSI